MIESVQLFYDWFSDGELKLKFS